MNKLKFLQIKNYNFYSSYFIFQQRRTEMECRKTDGYDRKETAPKKRYKKNNYFSDEEDFSE